MGLISGNNGGGESFVGVPKTFSRISEAGTATAAQPHTILNVTGKGILTSITQSITYPDNHQGVDGILGYVDIIIDGVSQIIGLATIGKSGSSVVPMFKFNNSLVIKHWQNSGLYLKTTGTYILQ